jgi:TP901 family phage tail tape measure protein
MADQVVFFRVEAQGVGDLVDQLGLLRKQASELQKEMRKAADPAEYTKLNRELENNRMAQKEVRSEVQKVQKAQKEQAQFASTSYRALNSELVALRRSYKELTSEERASKFGEQTILRIQQLDQELRQVDATMGQFQRNVGNYPGGNRGIAAFGSLIQQTGGPLGNFIGQVEGFAGPLTQMGESLGLTAAGAAGAAAGVAAVGIVAAKGVANAMEYETAFAQLSATLGVSGDEADALKERISELQTITLDNGASIVSTSTQIADALTVVGSAAPQLLKNQAALQAVTKEVIVFSKSAGTDLAESARVVTGAINLFGLEASEAARVINVLAAGEKEGSATTLEAADALEKAGGAARISGVSIEETTAAIQLLAKDSLKGSEAGTQLRNVLLKLSTAEALPPDAQKAFQKTGKELEFFSDKTVPLVEKLQALKSISGDTAAMTKIFGTENINAAISLTKYADEFPNLTAAITGTSTAYDQAGVKQETFAAKLENLQNKLNNVLTVIGEALIPLLSVLADYWMAVIDAVGQVGTAIGDVVSEITGAETATFSWGEIVKKVGNVIIAAATGPLKLFALGIRNLGAIFAGVKAVIGDIPTAVAQLVADAIDHLTVFTLKAKGLFANASNFISFGLASGGEEYFKQADAVYNDMQKRAAGNVDILGKFSAAYNGFWSEAEQKDKMRKEAADNAVKAEQEQLDMAQKLEAQAEADAENQKERDAAAKKAADEKKKADEEAAKQAEIERRNLAFLREELAKVEEKLKGYKDKNLIPTALLQSYNSLKNEIANVEKELADLFKAAEPIKIPVEIDQTSIQKINADLVMIGKMTAKEAYKSAKAVADAGKKDEKSAKEDAQKRLDEEKDLREQIKEASIQLAQDASDAIFELEAENAERRLEKRLEEIDQQESAQLALVEGNAIAEQQVLEQFAAQREQLQREEFERKKRMDIAQAIMNGALGVTSALTQVPAGFVMAALVAAQTAIQVATIAAQEFARGGLIEAAVGTPKAESGIFVGPSHAGGGINARLSGRLVNVEGGEYYERLADGSSVVINKRSTSRFMRALQSQAGVNYPGKLQTLSRINELGGGVPLYATGGLIAPMGNASADRSGGMGMEVLALAIDKMNSRVPVLTLQSFDTVNARANQVRTLQGL